MTTRNYSSTAASTTLVSGINNSVTSLVVSSATGFPAAPFILVLDPEVAGQELVLVTAVAGTTMTVTRGYDSTSAASHSAGAVVKHAHAAIDFRDAAAHAAASTGVHGAVGSVVGTSDVQALSNKTLGNTNTVNGFAASKVMVSDGTGKLAASSQAMPAGTLLGTTDTQVLTNKDLTSGTNSFPTSLATLTGTQVLTNKDLTSGTNTFPTSLATLTGTQVLTNKDLTSSTNTFPASKPFAEAVGTITVDGSSVIVGGFATVAITFPVGRFTVAPKVFFTIDGFVSNTSQVAARYSTSVTTSGCNLAVVNLGSGTVSWTALPLAWHAIQMTSGSAVG